MRQPGDAFEATEALRARSADRLREGFARCVARAAAREHGDPRDEWIAMTPYVDCARRLGLDAAAALSPVVADAPAWYRDAFERFVARTDITLGPFGWALVDGDEGPEYRFAWPW